MTSSAGKLLETNFAPAGRDSPGELVSKRKIVAGNSLLQETIDAMSDIVLILNGHRQIISVNQALLHMLDCKMEDIQGKRPGELVGCRNAAIGPDGCGTATGCMTCGAVEAILASQQSVQTVTRECRISLQQPSGEAMDLKVSARGVDLEGEKFTICVLSDISDQKRVGVLARLFYHDVMNTAGGIHGYVQLLRETATRGSAEDQDLAQLAELADHLIEEIQAQRDLTYAEAGELQPDFRPTDAKELVLRLKHLYAGHAVARDRTIQLGDVWEGSLVTDPQLLARVVGNMIKNALEAAASGETVTVSVASNGADVSFRVHNPEVMPQEVQLQVFQRSFSTKANAGRGIGTHSMKLIGERYLRGRVDFTSREPDGTTFTITLPKVNVKVPTG